MEIHKGHLGCIRVKGGVYISHPEVLSLPIQGLIISEEAKLNQYQ